MDANPTYLHHHHLSVLSFSRSPYNRERSISIYIDDEWNLFSFYIFLYVCMCVDASAIVCVCELTIQSPDLCVSLLPASIAGIVVRALAPYSERCSMLLV